MWEIVKSKEDARVAIHQYEWTDERTGKKISGPVMYSFLSTISDLANNRTGELACGEQRIARETGMSRQHVQLLMRVAERYSFVTRTGRTLPKYNTRIFAMNPRPFLRLKLCGCGYSDITYSSIEEIQRELGFSWETAALLFWQQEVLPKLRGASDEEFAKAATPYVEAGVIRKHRENLTPAQKRERFMRIGEEMGLPATRILRQSQEQLRIAT